jgi:uncharacterized membrane protein
MENGKTVSRKELFKWTGLLAAFTCFDICLVVYRVKTEGDFTYAFLVWNLILAWLPFLFSALAVRSLQRGEIRRERGSGSSRPLWLGSAFSAIYVILWLLFYPNAPYLITDLKHFHYIPGTGAPYSILLLLFSFVWTGVLLGTLSLLWLHRFVREKYGAGIGWLFAAGSLVIGAVGVFIGRFLRWNSWDMLADPHKLLNDLDRATEFKPVGFIFLFACVNILTYLTVYSLMRKE